MRATPGARGTASWLDSFACSTTGTLTLATSVSSAKKPGIVYGYVAGDTAAIAGLVAYGLSWPVAILIIAAHTLLGGTGLVWVGFNRLSMARLAPSKTLDQLQKDSTLTKQI